MILEARKNSEYKKKREGEKRKKREEKKTKKKRERDKVVIQGKKSVLKNPGHL